MASDISSSTASPFVPSSSFTRVVLRFIYVYIGLYSVYGFAKASAFLVSPLLHGNILPVDAAFKHPVPWFAMHVLRFHQPLQYSRAGDASFSWVEHLLFLLVALAAALLWSLVDRKRTHFHALDQPLRLFVRLTLAFLMFVYGFDKVFPLQFHSITRSDLVAQLGNFTHFDLMWRFMAASTGYTLFSGLLEVSAGVLLLVPPLANLGALACATIMVNVVALNIAYSIPVKLFSTNILLMALFLIAPMVPRLVDVLVLNRPTSPVVPVSLSSRPAIDRAARALQLILGFALFFIVLFEQRARYERVLRSQAATVPLQGIWQVDDFTAPASPLFTSHLATEMHLTPGDDRWLRLIFEQPQQLVIQTRNGQLDLVDMDLSKDNANAELTDSGDESWKASLSLDQPEPDRLHLHGIVNGTPIEATLHRLDESQFDLKNEVPHLVNSTIR